MTKIFILILFLIYFWYFYLSLSKPVPKPSQGTSSGPRSYHVEFMSKDKSTFQFKVNDRVVWEEAIPESHTFVNKQLIDQDVCHSMPDGQQIVAEGVTLYNYLKENLVSIQSSEFKMDAATVFQKGKVFYFTCQGGRIHKLDKCPSGQLFYKNKCENIDVCTGKKDGTLLPINELALFYYRCQNGKKILEGCPIGEFFLINNCHPKKDLAYYCEFFTDSFLLNVTTRVDCVNKLPVYVTCEPGTQFFDLVNECESTACVGKADGTKIPNDAKVIDGLSFHGGYMTCQHGRVIETVTCPQSWDPYLSNGDNLTHLPMVFDGQKCAIPTFCTNVQPTDPHHLVPVHEFSKHIGNWIHAEFYDTLACYRCEGKKRRRIELPPGQQIKRFKRESACQNRNFVPILGRPKEYFNCQTGKPHSCDAGKEFDGLKCELSLPHPFKFNDLSFFQFDELSHDNWIVPWNYSKIPTVDPCPASTKYLRTFNICAHPDCEKYTFLSHIPSMQITNEDGSICTFQKQNRLLTKTTSEKDESFDFWSQRKVTTPIKECVGGQNLKTGNFIWDKTLFATCDVNQPFVFCPSSATLGIIYVEGKTFACQLPAELNRIEFVGSAHFEKHEVKRITPTKTNQVIELTKNHPITLQPVGIDIDEAIDLHAAEPVILEYKYRVTHPPNVVYNDGIPFVGKQDGAFLIKRADVTFFSVRIPEYNVQTFMSDLIK